MADRLEIVHAERAREAIAGGVTVLDARGPNEYEAGHVEGAIHVPLGSSEEGFDGLPRDGKVTYSVRRPLWAVVWEIGSIISLTGRYLLQLRREEPITPGRGQSFSLRSP